jgi:hypothetical protein
MNTYLLTPVDIAVVCLVGAGIGCVVMLGADFVGRWLVARDIRRSERNAVQRMLEQSKHINSR